jgi:hypothetical protein
MFEGHAGLLHAVEGGQICAWPLGRGYAICCAAWRLAVFQRQRVLKLCGLQGSVKDPGPFLDATAVVVAAKQESAG